MDEADRRQRLTAVESELAYLKQERRTMKRHGMGETPCILVIDMQRFFIREGDPAGTVALEATEAIVQKARKKKLPVIFLKVIYDSENDINIAQRERHLEASRPLFRGEPLAELHPLLNLAPEDLVIEKKNASGFAGSTLKEQLDAFGCDTIFLTGTTTSGCVRATAVEGTALGFRMIVVEEASYEPRPLSGPVALSELADRYADVVSLDEALHDLDQL